MSVLACLGAASAATLLEEAAGLARHVSLVLSLIVLGVALVVVVSLIVLERALVGGALVVLGVSEAEAGVAQCQQGVRSCEHRFATGVVREVVGSHDFLNEGVDVDPRHARRAEEAAVLGCDSRRDFEGAFEHVGKGRNFAELVAEDVQDVVLSCFHYVGAEQAQGRPPVAAHPRQRRDDVRATLLRRLDGRALVELGVGEAAPRVTLWA